MSFLRHCTDQRRHLWRASIDFYLALFGGGKNDVANFIILATGFKTNPGGGGLHSTEVALLLLTQQPQVQCPAFPKLFKIKNY